MRRHHLALLTTALLLLSACQSDEPGIGESEDGFMIVGQSEVEETSVRGVSPGLRTLVLSGFTGNIRLSGSNDPNARLEFTKRARADDDTGARRLLGDVQVDEAGTDDSYTFTMQSERPEQSAVDVSGTVPADTPIRIEMQSGTIELTGVDGPLDITSQHGDIRVSGPGSSVRIVTRNGDVELGMRLVPSDANVSVTTSNGDLMIGLPTAASAQLDARTSAGGIRAAGLSFTNRRLQTNGAGSRLTGQLGQGNAPIELRTENGSIIIEEGLTMELPADTLAAPVDTLETDTLLDDSATPTDTTGADVAEPDTSAQN